jgi:putative cell wall-binding protein
MRSRDISVISSLAVLGAAFSGTVLTAPAVHAAAVVAGASGADVAPINWGAFGAGAPTDPASQRMAQILRNSSRYLSTTWYTQTYTGGPAADGYLDLGGGAEQNVRLPAMAALSTATALKLNVYDAGAAGISQNEATQRTLTLIRAVAHRHAANNTNAAVANWGNDWQSPLWAYYGGQAAWLMWDQLSPSDRDDVARMIASEADRLLSGDDVYLTSDHTNQLFQYKKDGTDVTPGDTKAEEDNGDADILGLAAAMMPNHPHAADWQRRNEDLLTAAAAKPADLADPSSVNGRQLSSWLQGTNIADDGTLQNHDILHPLYMTALDQSLQEAGTFALAGQCTPEAAKKNIGTVYNALTSLKTFQTVDPADPTKTTTLTMPNPIYQPGSAQINYPQGNDWGTQFPAYYGSFDSLVGTYGLDSAGSADAANWEALHDNAELALQARFPDGRTYAAWNPATTPANQAENSYVGAEQRVGQISAQAYMAQWLNHQKTACWDSAGTPKPPNVPPPQPAVVSRIAGTDRYATGVQVSQRQWSNAGGDGSGRQQAQAVVLARGDLFPDALAGVPLSKRVRGPLLLTAPGALNQASENEIRRILPAGANKTVYILGGVQAVSPTVENRLRALGYNVQRYGGADRFGTALDIANRGMGSPRQVIVATGLDFPDALAAGPLAAAEGNAILLSNGKTLDPGTAAYIRNASQNDPNNTFHLNAVGGAAVTATKYLGGRQHTLWGADRYATAAAVATRFAQDMPVTRLGLATGTSFADALTGGAYMANAGQPLLLTDPSVFPGANLGLLNGMQNSISSITLFGGPVAIHQNVMNVVTGIVRGVEQ